MAQQRITEKTLKALTPPPRGNKVVYDSAVTGFGARITAAGKIAFILRYVFESRERRMTLGPYPGLSVGAAREMAETLRGRIASEGVDPLAEREQRREAPTMADLANEYLERHATKKRASSVVNDKSILDRLILPLLGNRKVAHVKQKDLEDIHAGLKATPYQANRMLALISKMMALAVQWEYRANNPAKGIEKYPEVSRDRWLSMEELRRLTDALNRHKNQQSANIVRLLLLTGARSSEVMSATWDQFDLGAGTWKKPSHHTKQKRDHHVPLSAAAMKLLAEMHETAESDYLFPGAAGEGPQTDIKNFWRSIKKAAGIDDVRVHDLRHTYASHLVSSGHSLELVGRLLGHTQAQTTKRYAHLSDDPLREAANRIGDLVERATDGEADGVVVPLRQ